MAKSKKELVAEYVLMGGAREDFPELLDDVKAAAIEDKIEAIKLQAQLLGVEGAKNSGAADAPVTPPVAPAEVPAAVEKAPEAAPAAATESAPSAPIAPEADKLPKAGVFFTLTGAASWGSSEIPGKSYATGKEFNTEDDAEIAIIRKSGLFREG